MNFDKELAPTVKALDSADVGKFFNKQRGQIVRSVQKELAHNGASANTLGGMVSREW